MRRAGAARACGSERVRAPGSGLGAPAVPAAGPVVHRAAPTSLALFLLCLQQRRREQSLRRRVIKGVALIELWFGFVRLLLYGSACPSERKM